MNLGSVRNSGLELLVSGKPIDRRSAQLELTTVSAAGNSNIVENVGNSQGYIDIGAGAGDNLYAEHATLRQWQARRRVVQPARRARHV